MYTGRNIVAACTDPPTITGAPTVDRVVKGYNATMRCHANGNPPVKYEWFRVSNCVVCL